MPKLLKDQCITDDSFLILNQDQVDAGLPAGDLMLPITALDIAIKANSEHHGQIGIWFDSHE